MINKETILLVDDEPDIIEIIQYNLEKEGYKVITKQWQKAIEIAENKNPDLIIFRCNDARNGWYRNLHAIERNNNSNSKTPSSTFLSARGEDYSQIAGFGSRS